MVKSMLRLLAILMAIGLIAAACGSDDDDGDGDESSTTTVATEEDGGDEAADADDEAADAEDDSTTTQAADGGDSAVEATGIGDGVLTVGTILPVTGDLAFLGPPEIAGSDMAVQDINAAGGVLGADVVLEQGDSGDTTTDLANQEVDRLLAAGSDVIVGAASSAVSKTVIDKITGAGVIQFSPANTSPDFTTYDDGGLYFRTAPSDLLQGKVLSDLLIEDGAESISVLYRQESYGIGLADSVKENFEGSGGTVDEFIAYAVDTESFDAEIDSVSAAGSDAIVVIGFEESAVIFTGMNERGIGPVDTPVYGVDGNIGIGTELDDPTIIAGLQATVPSVDLATITDFTARLDENGAGGEYSYGAETYDSVIITALATEIAGSDDPSAIAAEINGVTKDGEKCTNFADCVALVQAGTDIDYDGVGGPYEFGDAGEPDAASFRIATYDGADAPNVELDRYVFAGG